MSTSEPADLTPEEWRERFAVALIASRRARGLAQEALGQLLASATRNGASVVQATVSSWEAGLTVPTAEQLFAIEKILGVHLGAYLGQEIPGRGRKNVSVAALIAHDPNLPPAVRPTVLAMYLAACNPPLRPHG